MPISEVEPMVASLRVKHDRSAALGVPAHITLLYPFHPPNVAEGQLDDLADLFSSISVFHFSFIEARRFPRTVYLHPDQAERFTGIINKLLQKWPGCEPYAGAFPDIIPHLTVADDADAQVLDVVQTSLAGQLPVRCLAKEAWLLFNNDTGLWSRRKCFPLGGPDLRSHFNG